MLSSARLSFLVGFVFIASALYAQFDTADVLGTVRDKSGSVLSRAAVTLINQDTGVAVKTISDSNGNYSFFNVKVGRYTITAELSGFSKFSTPDVVVNVNARQRVDITMDVGVVTQTVEVMGAASSLETDSSEHGQVIHTQQIVELTRDAGRNERPSWAPDGRHIVFESTRSGTRQSWVMLADGTQAHQLTTTGHNESTNWSMK